MKYRALDAAGDYTISPKVQFLVNSPAAVAQAVDTRIRLTKGEWFLDNREGLDLGKILGVNTQSTRDFEIQQRILGTPGVTSISDYWSSSDGRALTVRVTIQTQYGATNFTGTY